MTEKMTENDLINRIIELQGLSEFHRNIVSGHVYDGIDYMKASGVPDSVIYSRKSIGVLNSYVTDVWNLTQGQCKLSPFLKERIIQLALEDDEKAGDENV